MKSTVYWSGVEYSYRNGSVNPDNLKGGFVYIFLSALDVIDSISKIQKSLNDQDLEPIIIEFIQPYDEELEWEQDEATEHYKNLYNKAKGSLEPIFDDFYTYEE